LAALASGVSFSFSAVHVDFIEQHAAAEPFDYGVSALVMLLLRTCLGLG